MAAFATNPALCFTHLALQSISYILGHSQIVSHMRACSMQECGDRAVARVVDAANHLVALFLYIETELKGLVLHYASVRGSTRYVHVVAASALVLSAPIQFSLQKIVGPHSRVDCDIPDSQSQQQQQSSSSPFSGAKATRASFILAVRLQIIAEQDRS